MSRIDRLELVRDMYRAFAENDREAIEDLIAEDFRFHAPPDPLLDRAGYFERCWPNAGAIESFEFIRIFSNAEEVFVTYEASKHDGKRFRNTEIFRFEGQRVAEVEVYFGWNV